MPASAHNPGMPNLTIHKDNQGHLARLRAQVDSGQPLTQEQSLLLIDGLEAVLRFPAVTRDMVSRGYVVRWLHETANPSLEQAGADAL